MVVKCLVSCFGISYKDRYVLQNVKYALHSQNKSAHMNLLLPHRFKKIGAGMTPLGLLLWLSMQFGYVKSLLIYCFGQPEGNYEWSTYHIVNIIAAVLGFLAFLSGLYFISFSKEKVEDEYVSQVRLETLQWAIYINFGLLIVATLFVYGTYYFNVMIYNMFTPLLFFIGRFYYVLYLKSKMEN